MGKCVSQKETGGKITVLLDAEETMQKISKFDFKNLQNFWRNHGCIYISTNENRMGCTHNCRSVYTRASKV